MAVETLVAFAFTALLIELTPGPNMTYLALVAASEGRRAGYAAVAGVALGLAIIGLAAALGVGELVQSSSVLYEALRWAGVAFLLYLAWDGWRSGTDVASVQRVSGRGQFRRGLVTNLLNPKAALFYIAVLPTFFRPEGSSPMLQATVLSLVYVAVATAVHAAIVALAGIAHPYLADPKWERRARRVLSALLAMVAIWFGVATAR